MPPLPPAKLKFPMANWRANARLPSDFPLDPFEKSCHARHAPSAFCRVLRKISPDPEISGGGETPEIILQRGVDFLKTFLYHSKWISTQCWRVLTIKER
jgi:hypothetical protein